MGIQAAERVTPAAVLAELSACDHAERAASARRLELAVAWAGLHPGIAAQPYDKVVESLIDDATGVAVGAIAEFAAVHGVSMNAGRQLIGDAVALHDRLPRCWRQLSELNLPAWKARLLAQASHGLGERAVGWLDTQAALLGAKLGVRTIKRLVLLAQARFEPEKLTDSAEKRWVRIGADTDDATGRSWLDGCLDTPDALDLDAALRQIAADLADDSADADLDRRRALALGVMARRALGQPELPDCGMPAARTGADDSNNEAADGVREENPAALASSSASSMLPGGGAAESHGDDEEHAASGGLPSTDVPNLAGLAGGRGQPLGDDAEQTPSVGLPTDAVGIRGRPSGARAVRGLGRPIMIYLHFDAAQLTDGCGGLAEVGTTGQLVTIDEIRRWCGTADSITIRPVIDLNGTRVTRGYEPTDVMREHIALRDRSCVFPCGRAAHPVRRPVSGNFSHDADHIVPYDSGGETSTGNLACLCRLHHVLKTHTGWRYEMIGPGECLWKSPAGQQYLRTDSGTTRLGARRRGRPEAA
ncbi:MAG: HNH endonuclease signature motif containing protein [Micropruina sp.]